MSALHTRSSILESTAGITRVRHYDTQADAAVETITLCEEVSVPLRLQDFGHEMVLACRARKDHR